MADINMHIREHSVVELLDMEGETSIWIHESLKYVYGGSKWMSAQLDNGFTAVTKLKGKHNRLIKSSVLGQQLQ